MSSTKAPFKAGIVGVSGYSGMELARILAPHPGFELTLVTSDKWRGKRLGDCLPVAGTAASLDCVTHADGQARFPGLDLLFLCTPAEVSIAVSPIAIAAGARVVDLSGAFRLAAGDYPAWYGFTHADPGLLAQAVYSMPEVNGEPAKLRAAKLVSNPGCYPTPSTFSVLPLLRAGLVEADPIFIDAKSGTTGGGRKATEEWSFSELADDVRAYRILRHQHQPEIERALALGGAFTPHLLPVKRGILSTIYAKLKKDIALGDLHALYSSFYAGETFVRMCPEGVYPNISSVCGSNYCDIGLAVDPRTKRVIIMAAIDNLVKGAAGQAVQNMNIMCGFKEDTGLQIAPLFP